MTGPESALQEDSMVQRAGVVSTPTALTAKGFSVPYTGRPFSQRRRRQRAEPTRLSPRT